MSLQSADVMSYIEKCKTPEDFATHAMELFGNPMLISDDNMRILGITDIKTGSERLEYMRKYRFLPPELTKDANPRHLTEDLWHPKHAYLFDMDGENHIVRVLRVNETIIGRVDIIEAFRPLTEDDVSTLELISSAISLQIYTQSVTNPRKKTEWEYYLEYLLDGNYPSDESLRQRMDQAHWHRGSCLYILCANNFERSTVLSPVDVHFLRPNDLVLNYQNYTVILFSRNRPFTHEQMDELKASAMSRQLHCGLSSIFSDMRELRVNYLDAAAALELGSRINGNEFFYPYCDYSTYNLIRSHQAQSGLIRYVPEPFMKLIAFDQEQSLDLLKTLRCYLYLNGSVSKTAEQLHVHKNTVVYRINKAFELLEHERTDGQFHLQLCTAIQILEYLDKERYFS